MRSSYTYSDTWFQTMLEEGIKGIFEHMNLISFFLKLGRETILTYTAVVDPYVSFLLSVFGEFIIILFITRHRDRLIWLITSSGILIKTDRSWPPGLDLETCPVQRSWSSGPLSTAGDMQMSCLAQAPRFPFQGKLGHI